MTTPQAGSGTRDNGGMTGRWLVVRCADGHVMADEDDRAQADALARDLAADPDDSSLYLVADAQPAAPAPPPPEEREAAWPVRAPCASFPPLWAAISLDTKTVLATADTEPEARERGGIKTSTPFVVVEYTPLADWYHPPRATPASEGSEVTEAMVDAAWTAADAETDKYPDLSSAGREKWRARLFAGYLTTALHRGSKPGGEPGEEAAL